MSDNNLVVIILAFILGCMCSGMMKQMCGGRLVEGIGIGQSGNDYETQDATVNCGDDFIKKYGIIVKEEDYDPLIPYWRGTNYYDLGVKYTSQDYYVEVNQEKGMIALRSKKDNNDYFIYDIKYKTYDDGKTVYSNFDVHYNKYLNRIIFYKLLDVDDLHSEPWVIRMGFDGSYFNC